MASLDCGQEAAGGLASPAGVPEAADELVVLGSTYWTMATSVTLEALALQRLAARDHGGGQESLDALAEVRLAAVSVIAGGPSAEVESGAGVPAGTWPDAEGSGTVVPGVETAGTKSTLQEAGEAPAGHRPPAWLDDAEGSTSMHGVQAEEGQEKVASFHELRGGCKLGSIFGAEDPYLNVFKFDHPPCPRGALPGHFGLLWAEKAFRGV
jgi:hypothetical protein